MHFIAMLACTMDLAVAYAPLTTLLSALIAVASCTAGLAVAAAGVLTVPRLVAAGTLMGAGVAGMHYMGMAAMRMAATTHYDTTLTLLAVLIAIGASIAALWLAFHMRGFAQMTGSALVMGVAVCGMHYTAMYGARFAPAAAAPAAGSLGGANLGTTVVLVVTVLLAGMLAIDVSRRRRRASVQI
jgi:NO-binding membrane sensor protein with MHYT domain